MKKIILTILLVTVLFLTGCTKKEYDRYIELSLPLEEDYSWDYSLDNEEVVSFLSNEEREINDMKYSYYLFKINEEGTIYFTFSHLKDSKEVENIVYKIEVNKKLKIKYYGVGGTYKSEIPSMIFKNLEK